MKSRFITITALFAMALVTSAGSFVYAASSPNFQVFSDSISIGGGGASSTNFNLLDSTGEVGVGATSSPNSIVTAGFISTEPEPFLGFSITSSPTDDCPITLSGNALNFGTITSSSVKTSCHRITVSTNGVNGYVTTIMEDGNLRSGTLDIDDVADGAVTAGQEEYGFRTISITNSNPNCAAAGAQDTEDSAIQNIPKTVASCSKPINQSTTALLYKVSIGNLTASGNYSQVVTFRTTGRF